MRRFFLTGIALLLLTVPGWAKERFYYTIIQTGLTVGKAELEISGDVKFEDRTFYLITLKAEGFNFLDFEKIYCDPKTLRPLIVFRDLNIFGNKEMIREDYRAQGITVAKTPASGKTEVMTIPKKNIENIYGFIQRCRNTVNFHIGDTLDLVLPTRDLKIKVVKETLLKAAGVSYDAVYLVSVPGKYKIWFSRDARHLPLRISGAVGFGNTSMVLEKVESSDEKEKRS